MFQREFQIKILCCRKKSTFLVWIFFNIVKCIIYSIHLNNYTYICTYFWMPCKDNRKKSNFFYGIQQMLNIRERLCMLERENERINHLMNIKWMYVHVICIYVCMYVFKHFVIIFRFAINYLSFICHQLLL